MNETFKLKKQFGQNFIKDVSIINKIINNTDIDKDTLVIEVGPGAGILTKALCAKAKNVIAYEIDNTLEPILTKTIDKIDNVEIIYVDFLKRDIETDIAKYEYKKLYLVANLPYYITTPIITKIISSKIEIDKIVVMIQKEVGERFSAKINSRAYNSLTVFLNYYFDVKKLFEVSRTVFNPVPNVDSVVIELNKKEERIELINEEIFFKLVRDSFVYKRKNIRNNLKNYDLIKIEAVLKDNNLDLTSRAENIPLEVFAKMANKIS